MRKIFFNKNSKKSTINFAASLSMIFIISSNLMIKARNIDFIDLLLMICFLVYFCFRLVISLCNLCNELNYIIVKDTALEISNSDGRIDIIDYKDMRECCLKNVGGQEKLYIKHKINSRIDREFYISQKETFIKLSDLKVTIENFMVN